METIKWKQLGGIVLAQSSITLAWVIYALYLPDLLVQLNFSRELATTLLIIEHGLEAIIEPTFGYLSDKSQQNIGTRLPWITLGIILASGFFILLPISLIFIPSIDPWRWIFPILVIFWASAMAIFRSPMLSLLGRTTSQAKLPIATSYVTLVQQFISAFRFTAYGFITSFSPIIVFAIGSFVLLMAATILRQVTPFIPVKHIVRENKFISAKVILIIIGTAISLSFSLRFLFSIIGQVLATQLEGDRVKIGLLIFSILLALFALLAGKIASKIGNTQTILSALVITAILIKFASSNLTSIILISTIIIIACSFSMVLNGVIPWVLQLVPQVRSGTGIGFYFGGFGAGLSFFDLFFQEINIVTTKASVCCFFLTVATVLIALTFTAKRNTAT